MFLTKCVFCRKWSRKGKEESCSNKPGASSKLRKLALNYTLVYSLQMNLMHIHIFLSATNTMPFNIKFHLNSFLWHLNYDCWKKKNKIIEIGSETIQCPHFGPLPSPQHTSLFSSPKIKKLCSLTMHFPLTSLDFTTIIFFFTFFFQHLLETRGGCLLQFVLSSVFKQKVGRKICNGLRCLKI